MSSSEIGMSSSEIKGIHIAIPNGSSMLVDINMDDLHIGFIEGHYTRTISVTEPVETRFGERVTRTIEEHHIQWGKWDLKKAIPYNETVTLREIHEAEAPFIITRMLVEFLYQEDVVINGIPQKIDKVALHRFHKWPFKPGLFKQLFDRMPSHPLYTMLVREKKKWAKHSGDIESLKRMRDQWLINKPSEKLPLNIYKLWYGKGAMILPETTGDFKGRELGTEYKI